MQSLNLGDNHGIKWSDDEDILYVLESDSNPSVIALDGSTFEIIHITHLMHKSLDFAIVETNGMLSQYLWLLIPTILRYTAALSIQMGMA